MKLQIGRRCFLQTSGLAWAGSALTSLAALPVQTRAAETSDRIKKAVGWEMIQENLSPEDKFRLVKDAGFEGVEINTRFLKKDAPAPEELARASEKVGIPILGIVENMSLHICSHCGHEEPIFGTGGGAVMAEANHVDFLGALPLDIAIRVNADSGKPTVVAEPESRDAQLYQQIARKTAAKLALTAKNYSGKFPNIVVQQV